MTKIFSRDQLTKNRARIPFPKDLRLSDHVREVRSNEAQPILEFIGTDSFGAEWNERRRYEIDAGRDQEPLLYQPIYNEIRDSSLPRIIDVLRLGPGGVVFEEVLEGGEVKFSTITSSEVSLRMKHYAAALEYSKDLVMYNELWGVPVIERAMGIAHNALLNNLHLSPFLTATYAAANQTAAVTSGASTQEDFMLTIEAAIAAARADTANPRRGPYALLVSSANIFTIEKALSIVPQTGVQLRSRAIDTIRSLSGGLVAV